MERKRKNFMILMENYKRIFLRKWYENKQSKIYSAWNLCSQSIHIKFKYIFRVHFNIG